MRRSALLALAATTLAACATETTTSPRLAADDAVARNHLSGVGSVVVTEADVARQAENTPPTRNWVLYTRVPTSTGTFVSGPVSPPQGSGSLELATPTSADKVYLFNYDQVGTRLADVTGMGYYTFRSAGAAQQVTALNIQVDPDGPSVAGGFTTLVFEPVYNTAQGSVYWLQWQQWDAIRGGSAVWWSTRAIPGVCAFSCYVTWSQIVAANPDATISGGFGLNQGSGNPGLTTAVDALTLAKNGASTTWNFEVFATPATSGDCKNGGWQAMRRADGTPFKNQGDCVSSTRR